MLMNEEEKIKTRGVQTFRRSDFSAVPGLEKHRCGGLGCLKCAARTVLLRCTRSCCWHDELLLKCISLFQEKMKEKRFQEQLFSWGTFSVRKKRTWGLPSRSRSRWVCLPGRFAPIPGGEVGFLLSTGRS